MEKGSIGTLQALVALVMLFGNARKDYRQKEISLAGTVLSAIAGGVLLVLKGEGILPYGFGLGLGVSLIALAFLSKGGIGLGDGFVLLALALLQPWEMTLASLLFALLICAGFAFLLLLRKAGRNTRLPFIPFLLVGYMIALVLQGGIMG